MTEFTARPPLHEDGFVGTPSHVVRTSRWRKSETTFGPGGRLLVTGLILTGLPIAFMPMGTAFWPVGLWFLLGYATLATLVLRDLWRPVPLRDDDLAEGWRTRLARRHPILGRSIPPWLISAAAIGVVATVGSLAWQGGDALHRFFGVAAMLAVGFGVALARWLDL